MKKSSSNDHLSAERLQAFLEGGLPQRDVARTEEHLAGCARCTVELDAWRVLFEDLDDLSSHRPLEGFADRVMAGVRIPEPLPLAARIRSRLAVVVSDAPSGHTEDGVLQDFLDGTLAARKATRVGRHLEQCSTCAGAADSWLAVLRRLEGLEKFTPREGFADRVMARVEIPEAVPLAARVRRRFTALIGMPTYEHLPAGMLQDFVDGVLPARALARVESHLGACATCASDAEGWRSVVARLDVLERFEPAPDFADRVMARIRMPQAAPAAVRTPAWSGALAAAWKLVPQTREAWAALSGIAVTPAVIVGLVFYVVFSHPTLTLGSLTSFLWWQATEVAAAAFSGFSAAALQSAELFGVYSLFEAVASAPLMAAGGAMAYSLVSALALRVLYRNLIANRPLSGRYAHVSAS